GLHHHGLAREGRRLPQRPRRLVRRPDLGPVGGSGSLRRVHGLHPALVLGAGRGGAGRRRNGAHRLFPARRRPRVPHLLHDRPGQRAGQRDPRPPGPPPLTWVPSGWTFGPRVRYSTVRRLSTMPARSRRWAAGNEATTRR